MGVRARVMTAAIVAGIAAGASAGVGQAAGFPGNSGSFTLTARSTTAQSRWNWRPTAAPSLHSLALGRRCGRLQRGRRAASKYPPARPAAHTA